MRSEVESGRDGIGKLVLEYDSFREFVQECSSRISEAGWFVTTEAHDELGTEVAFEARVSDGMRLLKGRGEVAWRRPSGSPGKPAGVAIRFLDLDEPSRRLLLKVVESYRREGTALFDLGLGSAEEAEVTTTERPAFEASSVEAEPTGEDEKGTEILPMHSIAALEDIMAVEPVATPEGAAAIDLAESLVADSEEPSSEEWGSGLPAAPAVSELEVSAAEAEAESGREPPPPEARREARPPERTLEELLAMSQLSELEPADVRAEGMEEFETQMLEALPEPVPPEAIVPAPADLTPAVDEIGDEKAPSRSAWGLYLVAALLALLAGATAFYFLVDTGKEGAEASPTAPESARLGQPRSPEGNAVEESVEESAGISIDQEAGSGGLELQAPASPGDVPVTAIERISWKVEGEETVLVLVGDGSFGSGEYPSLRLRGEAPRLILMIHGVSRPFRPSLSIGSPHVLRVRTGLHPEAQGMALHVVADLTSDRVELVRIEPHGSELHVVLSDG